MALRPRPSDFAHVLFVERASLARPILSAWQYRAWASSDRLFSSSFSSSTELIPGIPPQFCFKRPSRNCTCGRPCASTIRVRVSFRDFLCNGRILAEAKQEAVKVFNLKLSIPVMSFLDFAHNTSASSSDFCTGEFDVGNP